MPADTLSGSDLSPRLLTYLSVELKEPRLGFADSLTPISGGFDTRVFSFRLAGATGAFSEPLILRLLGAHHDPARALREATIQNVIAGEGYPAPRALLATADTTTLGGGFMIMQRLGGRPLPDQQFFGMDRILVEAQLRLHALDPARLIAALGATITFDAYLDGLATRVRRSALHGLVPAMEWLLAHRPPHPRTPVICHGDFHPYNILVAGGAVTGVVDWPNAVVADRALDVAATKVILALAPLGASKLSAPERWAAAAGRPILVKRYLRGYGQRHLIDRASLAYHEVLSCMRALIRAAETTVGEPVRPGGRAALLDTPAFLRRLSARVAKITGITPALTESPVAPAGPR